MRSVFPPRFSFPALSLPALSLPALPLPALAVALAPQAAQGQTLTVYNSAATYTAALPTTGLVSSVESFAGITANAPVSQGTPDNWNGFSLRATGTSIFGSSTYCTSLSACLNWTPSPPNLPGVYAAVDEANNGRIFFILRARAFAFGVDYWDWNDTSQRSRLLVLLSTGAVITVTGPTTNPGVPGGFIGFQLDLASVRAGISITAVTWEATPGQAEIIGLRNVRTSAADAVVAIANGSQLWNPASANLFAIPTGEVLYRLDVSNSGLAGTDTDSVFVVNSLPAQVQFWNGDIDAGGPEVYAPVAQVGFSQANGAALTFTPSTDFGISTAAAPPTSFAQCTPATLDGTFRADVRHLCFRPRGQLPAGAATPTISFVFRARIN